MMRVMLETGVDDAIVGRNEAVFVASVKIHAISIKEQSELQEEQVDVDRDHQGNHHKRKTSKKLIYGFVGNHGKRGWIVENVMVSVMPPELKVNMTKSMVDELVEICQNPTERHHSEMIGQRSISPTTKSVAHSVSC